MKNIFRKTWFKRLLIAFIAFIVIMVVLQIIPPKKTVENNPFIKKDDQGVMIAAHRGGKHLNPENTFKAFDYSLNNYDIDILELDLVMTKDGHLVSIHDETINRSSDVEEITGSSEDYFVKDHTLDELLMFNFGYKFIDKSGNAPYKDIVSFDDVNRKEILKENNLNIVTIDEIFEKYKDLDLLFIVEIKDDGEVGKKAADYLYDLMTIYSLFDRVTIGTFHDDISSYLTTNYPEILRGGSVGDVTGFVVTQMLRINIFKNDSFACLQIPSSQNAGFIKLRLDKLTYINRAHRRGISVQYWTINDKEEMRHLIELGADVIMTDSPDILYELLVEMGYR